MIESEGTPAGSFTRASSSPLAASLITLSPPPASMTRSSVIATNVASCFQRGLPSMPSARVPCASEHTIASAVTPTIGAASCTRHSCSPLSMSIRSIAGSPPSSP
jgi:hypothetical protein